MVDKGSDDVYGDLHFIILSGATFKASHPAANAQGVIDLQGNNDFPMPVRQSGQSNTELYVTVHFDRGSRITTSYIETAPKTYEKVGELTQIDYEYELYRLATKLYPDCPSAGYELLRFGRILGPDNTTHPVNWQAVPFDEGKIGYIDLAQLDIIKLSDADFPHWQGWRKIEEGAAHNTTDGLCDVAELLDILSVADENSDGVIDDKDREAKLKRPDVKQKLHHLIVKHPSEWDKSTNDAKFALLREAGQPLENPEDWKEFKEHIEKIQFWTDAGLGESSVSHFHPLEFIRHFRRCGWLSLNELKQLVPVNIVRKPGRHDSNTQGVWESPSISAAHLIATCSVDLNKAMRKFLITTPMRKACFLGNAIQETGWLHQLNEQGGLNDPTLHQGWYGRGFLQLTNPHGRINAGDNNYYEYFKFIGLSPSVPPMNQEISWRNQISTNTYHAAHSAGAYWIWTASKKNSNTYADINTTNQHNTITTNANIKTWYYNRSFAQCAASVNLPSQVNIDPPNAMNGLVDRSFAFVNVLMVLMDTPEFIKIDGQMQPMPENFTFRRP